MFLNLSLFSPYHSAGSFDCQPESKNGTVKNMDFTPQSDLGFNLLGLLAMRLRQRDIHAWVSSAEQVQGSNKLIYDRVQRRSRKNGCYLLLVLLLLSTLLTIHYLYENSLYKIPGQT